MQSLSYLNKILKFWNEMGLNQKLAWGTCLVGFISFLMSTLNLVNMLIGIYWGCFNTSIIQVNGVLAIVNPPIAAVFVVMGSEKKEFAYSLKFWVFNTMSNQVGACLFFNLITSTCVTANNYLNCAALWWFFWQINQHGSTLAQVIRLIKFDDSITLSNYEERLNNIQIRIANIANVLQILDNLMPADGA